LEAQADRENKFSEAVREMTGQAHTQRMEESAERNSKLIVAANQADPDVARAIHSLSDTDLVRLKALARLWARGLPKGLSWSDILHEAIARALDGSRQWPAGVSLVAFLSGVMRSICADTWRREELDADFAVLCATGDATEFPADPERLLSAAQSLAAISQVFAADPAALRIIAGLADGLTVAEICKVYAMSEREYDTTRKRMRRALLRCGLDWSSS
jgi:DNA-directed RNA polymerase specialized sigma24 family protein